MVGEWGDGVAGEGGGITGNGIGESSEHLVDEDFSGTSRLSFSIGISSKVGNIARSIYSSEINPGGGVGILEGGFVSSGGEDSDHISSDIDVTIGVVGSSCVSIINRIEKGHDFHSFSRFKIGHELYLFHRGIYDIGIFILIFWIEGKSTHGDTTGDVGSEGSLVGDEGSVVGSYFYGIFWEWECGGFYL
jgi:hypothetical protein